MQRSVELEAIIERVPEDFADPLANYQAVREMMAPFHGHPVDEGTSIAVNSYGGVNVGEVSVQANEPGDWVAFHCHGGAFVSCPLDDYFFYGEIIARELGARVFIPDYRLAPEDKYPAAHEDCFNAYRGLLEQGFDPKKICLIGESCGGSLALGLMLKARDQGLALPACFVSLTGWFDLSVAKEPSERRDPFLSAEWVRNRAKDYTGGQLELSDPRLSPAYADLTGLPPMYLQIGQFDTVREGAIALAANGVRDGVDVYMESWPGMIQGWHGLINSGVPESEDAWLRIRHYVESYIGPEDSD